MEVERCVIFGSCHGSGMRYIVTILVNIINTVKTNLKLYIKLNKNTISVFLLNTFSNVLLAFFVIIVMFTSTF